MILHLQVSQLNDRLHFFFEREREGERVHQYVKKIAIIGRLLWCKQTNRLLTHKQTMHFGIAPHV